MYFSLYPNIELFQFLQSRDCKGARHMTKQLSFYCIVMNKKVFGYPAG
jgi:hypothetical protein